ncbi:MAG: amino acid permease [Acidimicrobiales bacterium]
MTGAGDPAAPAASGSGTEPGTGSGPDVTVSPPAPVRPPASPRAPVASAVVRINLPETLRYRLKNKLLGRPLVNEQLTGERLGRPSALGVLAPDCISSSAYGTEEMLNQLVPFVGLAAFALVVPITMAILGVLFFVTLSYLDVIKLYTQAGGAYVVARENFGPKIAQIAAVALLIDYTVTVAVQTAAGTDALTSAFPRLTYWTVPITVGVVLLLLYGNLRGIKEAGRFFAFPTYFFIFSLAFVVVSGYIKQALGDLHAQTIPYNPSCHASGTLCLGHSGSGLLYGATFIVILRSFANGGSSLTGLEAISNGVATFRQPASRHARQTLVVMSSVLAFLVLGVTLLAHWTHAVPYNGGSPTVVSQEVKIVLGNGAFGRTMFYLVQFATVLILYTGGNTSFNGFPFLASYVASDAYLPKQLTRRGHRLAFSNGIIVLTVVALLLIIATGADLNALVALYAIGVFTGFTMAGSGMVKHFWDERSVHWKRHVGVNGFSAFLSLIVVLIFAIVKFREGAWVVVFVGPLMFYGLIRLHRQYASEEEQLEQGASEAAEAPVLNRHVVVVLVDRLDMATARALQYARTLHPDELRAVHFALDQQASEALEAEWRRLGLTQLPLDIEACEDRRLTRAALELAAETVADQQTELTILLPRRGFAAGWQRVLHDATADHIAAAVGQLNHVNATVVPYQLTGGWFSKRREWRRKTVAPGTARPGRGARSADRAADREAAARATFHRAAFGERARGTIPIGEAQWRNRVRVAGQVRSVRVQPRAGTANLECVLADDSGKLLLVFQGRRRIPGIQPGARLVVEGMVGDWARRQAILNPDYELIAGPEAGVEPT